MFNGFSRPKSVEAPKRMPWNWVEALLVGSLALVGADLALGLIISGFNGILKSIPSLQWVPSLLNKQSIGLNFVYYGLSRLLGFSLIVFFIHRRGVSLRQFGFKRFKFGKAAGLILLASLILLAATVVVFLIVQQTVPSVNLQQNQDIIFGHASTLPELVMAFLALVVIAPIVEESIFRGLMLPIFSARFGIVTATVVTSVLFGLVHWQLNVSIVTGVMGFLLAWLYYKTRSLWPAIMFHSLKNLVAFILIFNFK